MDEPKSVVQETELTQTASTKVMHLEAGGKPALPEWAQLERRLQTPAWKNADRRKLKVTKLLADENRSFLDLPELWDYRELILNFCWRDLTTRYRQSILGISWAVVQPLFTMIVLSVFFGRFMHVPTDNVPYPLFACASLLPWQYFCAAVTRCSNSVLGVGGLIKKIYFPRLTLPISSVIPPLVDFSIAFVLVIGLMIFYGTVPTMRVFALPLFVGLAVINALGVGVWTAALHVKYRDIFHLVPFVLQLWMFASPVAYSSSVVPAHLRILYDVNPLVGVLDGFRWSLLGTTQLSMQAVICSAVIGFGLLISGTIYFRKSEGSFSDFL